MATLDTIDARFLRLAYEEALAGFNEGGCPIGSVLAEGERLIARGRNQRVQQGDPIAHGEMACLRHALDHELEGAEVVAVFQRDAAVGGEFHEHCFLPA